MELSKATLDYMVDRLPPERPRSDMEMLETLADWFDHYDDLRGVRDETEVQDDLRRIARWIDGVRSSGSWLEGWDQGTSDAIDPRTPGYQSIWAHIKSRVLVWFEVRRES